MDYEKKYKEALERARICHKDMSNLDGVTANMAKDFFEEVFPELAESEDEKTRKEIIAVFKGEISYTSEEDAQKYIAWLEKQGGQKPAWTAQDEERLQSCLNILQAKGIMGVTETINTKWLKSLKERIKNA